LLVQIDRGIILSAFQDGLTAKNQMLWAIKVVVLQAREILRLPILMFLKSDLVSVVPLAPRRDWGVAAQA
jgi:hypothetical protein